MYLYSVYRFQYKLYLVFSVNIWQDKRKRGEGNDKAFLADIKAHQVHNSGELFTCLAIGSITNVMYMFIYYVRMYMYYTCNHNIIVIVLYTTR